MAERDEPQGSERAGQADRTLLGVAPPHVESSETPPTRSPVLVRSGTVEPDAAPLPLPRAASELLPSRPLAAEAPGVSQAPSALSDAGGARGTGSWPSRSVRVAGKEVAAWKLLGAVAGVAAGLGVLSLAVPGTSAKPAPVAAVVSVPAAVSAAPAVSAVEPAAPAVSLAQLEAKSPETLSSSEVFSLADGRAAREREASAALRQKLALNPDLAKDKALQAELLRLAGDADTAPNALGAMARLPSSIGPDLLYETWTATSTRSDATELARSLVYSTDVRPNASPALAVALELRAAQSCDDYKLALPKALKDGDRRVVHLLTKLNSKRGCGAKKAHDCFACLREPKDELTATINAVKSRRAPSYPNPSP